MGRRQRKRASRTPRNGAKSKRRVTAKPIDDQMSRILRQPAKLQPGALDALVASNEAYKAKQRATNESLSTYAKRVTDARDHIKVVKPAKEGGMYELHLSESCRMTEDEGNGCIKALPSDKGFVGEALNLRNSCSLGVPEDSDFIVYDHNETVVAIMFRNKIPPDYMKGWKEVEEDFDFGSEGWTMGCEAAPYPDLERMTAQLRDRRAATKSGVADNMVVESVGPKVAGETTGLKERYRNASGRLIERATGPWINRTSMDYKTLMDLASVFPQVNGLFGVMVQVYLTALQLYMSSRNWPEDEIKELTANQDALELTMSPLKVNDGSSRCGVHRDNRSPFPAAVAGPTVHEYNEASGAWVRKYEGGRLFLADGMISLEYGPGDIVVFSGNWPHGITSMRQKGEMKKGEEMERFSTVLFSKYLQEKGMMKHGRYDDSY